MSSISDQLPEGGRPPTLLGNAIPSLETIVKEKAEQERDNTYERNWNLTLTEGGKCSFQDVLTVFRDVHEFMMEKPVIDNSLVGNTGAGFYLDYEENWEGNPREGFRRPVTIVSGGFPEIHLECWIGIEWQDDPKPVVQSELTINIRTNWGPSKDQALQQFMSQRFIKIGYQYHP